EIDTQVVGRPGLALAAAAFNGALFVLVVGGDLFGVDLIDFRRDIGLVAEFVIGLDFGVGLIGFRLFDGLVVHILCGVARPAAACLDDFFRIELGGALGTVGGAARKVVELRPAIGTNLFFAEFRFCQDAGPSMHSASGGSLATHEGALSKYLWKRGRSPA